MRIAARNIYYGKFAEAIIQGDVLFPEPNDENQYGGAGWNVDTHYRATYRGFHTAGILAKDALDMDWPGENKKGVKYNLASIFELKKVLIAVLCNQI